MYRIAFGLDTETIEDPDQMVLLDLPDDFSEVDTEELEYLLAHDHEIRQRRMHEPADPFTFQPMIGVQDVIESFVLAMLGEGIPQSQIDVILTTVFDAVTNAS